MEKGASLPQITPSLWVLPPSPRHPLVINYSILRSLFLLFVVFHFFLVYSFLLLLPSIFFSLLFSFTSLSLLALLLGTGFHSLAAKQSSLRVVVVSVYQKKTQIEELGCFLFCFLWQIFSLVSIEAKILQVPTFLNIVRFLSLSPPTYSNCHLSLSHLHFSFISLSLIRYSFFILIFSFNLFATSN